MWLVAQLSASIPMHVAWETKRRSWWPLQRWKNMTRNLVGWIAQLECCDWWTYSEGTGKEGAGGSCTELFLKNSNMQVKSLWVKISNQANKGNFVVGVYYRPSNRGKEVDEELFILQLHEASCLQVLVLTGNFNRPDICWKSASVKWQAAQETTGVHWQQLSSPGDGEPEHRHCWMCCSLTRKNFLERSRWG